MSGIRAKNTKPELLVRRGLHAQGFRFRLHARDVPGKPDLVLRRYDAAILIHGCFWHGHHCHLFKMPSTRPEFWKAKINRNIARDREVRRALEKAGWRALTVWECALKGRTRLRLDIVISQISRWLKGGKTIGDIAGTP